MAYFIMVQYYFFFITLELCFYRLFDVCFDIHEIAIYFFHRIIAFKQVSNQLNFLYKMCTTIFFLFSSDRPYNFITDLIEREKATNESIKNVRRIQSAGRTFYNVFFHSNYSLKSNRTIIILSWSCHANQIFLSFNKEKIIQLSASWKKTLPKQLFYNLMAFWMALFSFFF